MKLYKVGIGHVLTAQRNSHIKTIGPRYSLNGYMDPLGKSLRFVARRAQVHRQ